MITYTPQGLDRIVSLAGSLAEKGVALSEQVHGQLGGTPTKGDLRSRSIYFAAVTAHDLELGIRVVKEMLSSQLWDLLYQPNGTAMYPGASVNANHFQGFVERGAFLWNFTILEGHFRNIHRVLAPGELNDATDKWWKIWTSLEQKIGGFASPDDRELIRLITVIRNCIHDCGTHRMPDQQIAFRNTKYSFRTGVPPNCLTLDFIVMCIDATMELMAHVSLSAQVRSLPSVTNPFDMIGQSPTIQQ
jgi:hypothetical protein